MDSELFMLTKPINSSIQNPNVAIYLFFTLKMESKCYEIDSCLPI